MVLKVFPFRLKKRVFPSREPCKVMNTGVQFYMGHKAALGFDMSGHFCLWRGARELMLQEEPW
jgi:hypothetical protein